jgi:hypothetical protein
VKNKSIQKQCFPTDKTIPRAKEKKDNSPKEEIFQDCNRKGKDSQYSLGRRMGYLI